MSFCHTSYKLHFQIGRSVFLQTSKLPREWQASTTLTWCCCLPFISCHSDRKEEENITGGPGRTEGRKAVRNLWVRIFENGMGDRRKIKTEKKIIRKKKRKQAVTKTVFKFYFYDPIMLNAFSIWPARVMTLRIPPFATVFLNFVLASQVESTLKSMRGFVG